MVQDLFIYRSHFEQQYVAATKTYYEAKEALWKEESVPAYLKLCEDRLNEEKARSECLLHGWAKDDAACIAHFPRGAGLRSGSRYAGAQCAGG